MGNNREASRWYSERIEQEIALVRWGHWGQPVLIFPTAGGDAEEIERMQLIAALWPLIEGGRIKVFSCDNLAGRAFAAKTGSVEYRCLLLNRFEEASRARWCRRSAWTARTRAPR